MQTASDSKYFRSIAELVCNNLCGRQQTYHLLKKKLWKISWVNRIHLGGNDWTAPKSKPHTTIYKGTGNEVEQRKHDARDEDRHQVDE